MGSANHEGRDHLGAERSGERGSNASAKNTAVSQAMTTQSLGTLPSSNSHDVGYKKPPTQTRFQKGQSGNPKGRPKGSKNKAQPIQEERLKSIIMEEAYRTVPVTDQGKTISIPIAQAVVRSLAVNAAKGNTRAQHLFTTMLNTTEAISRQRQDELMEAAIHFKIEWEREFERCDRLGIARPEPIPHPDHVIVDMRRGTVQFKGPMTKEEKDELVVWVQRKADFEEELGYLQNQLKNATTDAEREILQSEIKQTHKVLDIIGNLIPD